MSGSNAEGGRVSFMSLWFFSFFLWSNWKGGLKESEV